MTSSAVDTPLQSLDLSLEYRGRMSAKIAATVVLPMISPISFTAAASMTYLKGKVRVPYYLWELLDDAPSCTSIARRSRQSGSVSPLSRSQILKSLCKLSSVCLTLRLGTLFC